MEINGQHPVSPERPGPPNGELRTGRGDRDSGGGSNGTNPAFIIDLGPRAAQAVPEDDGPGNAPTGPGKSAESPAHKARALIAQFLALSETQESPFKAFGHIVSQLAQGRTFEEIFPPVTETPEESDDAAATTADPTATLLDDFVEGGEGNNEPVST